MIEKDSSFSLDGVVSDLCIKVEAGSYRTHAVLAVIRHRRTKTRQGPPRCGSGFETAYLPFAKGHVIALEAGGSDNPYNVVPQFEDWQGKPNGAWRMMEIALAAPLFAGQLMLVEIGYGRRGDQEDPLAAISAFQTNHIRSWSDPRIPDNFEVHVWDSDEALTDITTDTHFDATVRRLKTLKSKFHEHHPLGNDMPQPDRANYVNQYALAAALDRHEALSRTESFPSFALAPGFIEEVRSDVAAMEGVVATEAAGLQTFPILFAYQAGVTEPKIRKKLTQRRKGKLPTALDEDIFGGVKRKADDDDEDRAGQPKAKKARLK